jgi:hypothetical protein
MKQRELFAVGVRLLGIWQLLQGIYDFVAWGNILTKQSTGSAAGSLTHALAYVITGFFLLFMSSGLIEALYITIESSGFEPIILSLPTQDPK